MTERDGSQGAHKIALSEGAEGYGSDGNPSGHVAAVGAHYLTIVKGLLGQEEWYLPIRFVARADSERVELIVSARDVKQQARRNPPDDEPTYTAGGESIPEGEREAVGLPVSQREDWGLGEKSASLIWHADTAE